MTLVRFRRALALILATALPLAAGCFSPPKPDCTFVCGANGACPSGYQCGTDNFCHLPGTPMTGCAVGMEAGPAPEAGTDAAVDHAIVDMAPGSEAAVDMKMVDMTPPDVLSGAKTISSFSFLAADNGGVLTSDVSGNIVGTAISVTVPNGTNVTALVASFTASAGATVAIGGTTQVSGTTANDFTSAVSYVVTAADSTTQTYTVTVTVAPNNAKAITAFSFLAADNSPNLSADVTAGIVGTAISATVPFGTDVTALVATFTTTGSSVKVGTTLQMTGTTANNFTSPVTYLVTAADTTTQSYTVTVTVAANPAKDITAFSFTSAKNSGLPSNVTGSIVGNAISATVPFGTDVTGLIATFTTTGASVAVGATPQVSGTTANDFTSPVMYVVTAADTSTKTYTVTVTIAPGHTVTVSGSGTGSVTSTPAGIACSILAGVPSGTCSKTLPDGPVMLTAAPLPPTATSTFVNWGPTGVCTGTTNPCSFTLSGTSTASANFDSGLSFDSSGNGKVTMAAAGALSPSSITVEGTFDLTAATEAANPSHVVVVSNGDALAAASQNGYQLGYLWNGTTFEPEFIVATTTGGGSPTLSTVTCLSSTALTAGVHQIAGQYDATSGVAAMWVDGTQVCTVTGTAGNAINASAGALTFAAPSVTDAAAPDVPFQGTLDDVRIANVTIYDASMTSQTPAQARQPVVTASTVGLWSCDEGSGTTIGDQSTTAAVGTIVGSGTAVIFVPEP
jgi:hypothetical protein